VRDEAAATAGNPAVCDADAIERLPRHTRTSSGDDTPHGSPPKPRQGALLPPHDPAALLAVAPPWTEPQPYTAASAADPPQRHRLAAWIPDSLPLRTTSVPAASLRAAAEEAEAADAQSRPAGPQARDCTKPLQTFPGGGPSGSWSYQELPFFCRSQSNCCSTVSRTCRVCGSCSLQSRRAIGGRRLLGAPPPATRPSPALAAPPVRMPTPARPAPPLAPPAIHQVP
jgi:hypothetical protein